MRVFILSGLTSSISPVGDEFSSLLQEELGLDIRFIDPDKPSASLKTRMARYRADIVWVEYTRFVRDLVCAPDIRPSAAILCEANLYL